MAVDRGLRDLLRSLAASDPGSQAYGLLAQGRGHEARDVARAAAELRPHVATQQFRLVVVELTQGRVRQARKAAEALSRLAPADPLSSTALALVLLAEHRWLDAEATISPVLQQGTQDEHAVWILALAFEGEGRRDAALEAFAWLTARGRRVHADSARDSIWRAWRWYELGGLGLMTAILIHLAIEAFRTPYEGAVARLFAIALVVTVAGLFILVRRRRKRLESMSEDARSAIAAESERRSTVAFLEVLPRVLVIGGIVVGLLVSQRALADASVMFEDLPIGTCFDWPPASVTPRVAPIPCGKAHHLELIAVVRYPGPDDSTFPGKIALQAFGDAECQRSFGEYVGVEYGEQDMLETNPLYAIEGYWLGHHDIYCTIRDPDWDKLTVSYRDAGG